MTILRRGSLAFASGAFGVILFYLVLRGGLAAGLLNPPEPALKLLTSKAFLYRSVVWGGIWGFAFMIPFLTGKWWLRGPIVGIAATLVAIFVFRGGQADLTFVIGAVILNVVCWGLTAAFWYDRVVKGG
ncbi:MAG: hypothetical protein P8Z76_01250 [Alphaproteobacteria bacterium]|jgi:hypothetical protein